MQTQQTTQEVQQQLPINNIVVTPVGNQLIQEQEISRNAVSLSTDTAPAPIINVPTTFQGLERGRCQSFTKYGRQCAKFATHGQKYCAQHNRDISRGTNSIPPDTHRVLTAIQDEIIPENHAPAANISPPHQLIGKVEIYCPICRKLNKVDMKQPKITGLESQCTVCWINPCQIFLPLCGHVCLCEECFFKMVE